jgi:hypothetical protein
MPPEPPNPYERWLDSIAIEPELVPQVVIARLGSQLVLRGGRRSLHVLADNVESFAQTAYGQNSHIHIEYYPGHFYLRESSVPVVVSIC